MYQTSMPLFLLVIGYNVAANETSRFLSGNGFEHLEPTFADQEIEVRQISSLPNQLLIDLGARLWLRSAAGQWVQTRVGCLYVCFNLQNF